MSNTLGINKISICNIYGQYASGTHNYTYGVTDGSNRYDAGYTIRAVLDEPRELNKMVVKGAYDYLQNKSSLAKVWRGTQAQYDAITTPDNNTIYIITAT